MTNEPQRTSAGRLIVLCIDLFPTSHEEGNFWQIADSLKYFGMLNEILILFINIFVDSYRSKQRC